MDCKLNVVLNEDGICKKAVQLQIISLVRDRSELSNDCHELGCMIYYYTITQTFFERMTCDNE